MSSRRALVTGSGRHVEAEAGSTLDERGVARL
jgi:hypothetical protein